MASPPGPATVAAAGDFELRVQRSIWGSESSQLTESLNHFTRYCEHEMVRAARYCEMRAEQLEAILKALQARSKILQCGLKSTT